MGPCPAARRPEQTHALHGCTACPGPGRSGAGPGQSRPCLGLRVHLVCPAGLPPAMAAPQARCPAGGSLSQDSHGLHHAAVCGGLAIRPTRRPDTEAEHPSRGPAQAAGAQLDTQAVPWTGRGRWTDWPWGWGGHRAPGLGGSGREARPTPPPPREVQEPQGPRLKGLGGWGRVGRALRWQPGSRPRSVRSAAGTSAGRGSLSCHPLRGRGGMTRWGSLPGQGHVPSPALDSSSSSTYSGGVGPRKGPFA